jgi:hypothetical protein
MKSDWEKRYRDAEEAWHQLKSFTKRVPLDGQTAEYRELSNMVHSLGRDVFYVNEDDYQQ